MHGKRTLSPIFSPPFAHLFIILSPIFSPSFLPLPRILVSLLFALFLIPCLLFFISTLCFF